MVSVTVSAMFTHLDNLVLDYIWRRNQISTPVTTPFYATSAPEDQFHDTQGITLEEIYLIHFVGSNGLRNNFQSLQTILSSRRSSYSTDKEVYTQTNLPRLPVEIVEHILEFGSVKHLRQFRCLGRSVNISLCKRLQHHNSTTINLDTRETTEDFLRIFGNKMQHWKLPFRDVVFGRNWANFWQVLEVVGGQLVVHLAELEATELTRDLLLQMNNVGSVGVYGIPNIDGLSKKDVRLPALRNIQIRQKHGEQYAGDELCFEYIYAWLQLAPSLRSFYSTLPAVLTPAQAFQLFRTCPSLSHIYLNGFHISWSNEEMVVTLPLMRDLGQTAEDVESYAPFVRTLNLPYGNPHRIPPFPRLTHLTLSNEYPNPLPPLQLHATPLLQHVTLQSVIANNFSATYRHFAFESVGVLDLSDERWTWTQNCPPEFHHIFPKVHTLKISGQLPVEFINYFATHFNSISNLKLAKFEGDKPVNLPLHQVRVAGRKNIEWPFSKFRNLKTLEFACDDGVRTTVLGLVWLTIHKLIQPLEKIRIAYSPVKEHMDAGERSLYYSMRHFKYHKELEFNINGPH